MQNFGRGLFEVRVDINTTKENVVRLARKGGWSIRIKEEADEYLLVLER